MFYLMKEKIVALGHVLSGQGIQSCTAKVEAIQDDPAPPNATELRAYLVLINYYHRYLRNLSPVDSASREANANS